MSLFSLPKRRGFTLIEMVVYAAMLGVISVLAINSVLSMTRAFADLRASRDVNSSATALFERLTRDIRTAYDVDVMQSTFGTNPGRLTVNTRDVAGASTTVEFFEDSGAIKIRQGGVLEGAITTTTTTVTNFVVYHLLNANTEAIKVDATLSATYGGATKSRNFSTTIVLRGTY